MGLQPYSEPLTCMEAITAGPSCLSVKVPNFFRAPSSGSGNMMMPVDLNSILAALAPSRCSLLWLLLGSSAEAK